MTLENDIPQEKDRMGDLVLVYTQDSIDSYDSKVKRGIPRSSREMSGRQEACV